MMPHLLIIRIFKCVGIDFELAETGELIHHHLDERLQSVNVRLRNDQIRYRVGSLSAIIRLSMVKSDVAVLAWTIES